MARSNDEVLSLMNTVRLKVTRPSTGDPELAVPAAVPGATKPLFQGNGDTDYVCGSCGAVIASRMGPSQHVIVDTTVCAGCGAENEFPLHLRA